MCVSIYSASCVSLCIPGREEQTNSLVCSCPVRCRGHRRGKGGEEQVCAGAETARQRREVWAFPRGSPGPSYPAGWASLEACVWALYLTSKDLHIPRLVYFFWVKTNLSLGRWKRKNEMESHCKRVKKEKRDWDSQGYWEEGAVVCSHWNIQLLWHVVAFPVCTMKL